MTTAIYPRTFDPIHRGHIDIIERTAKNDEKAKSSSCGGASGLWELPIGM